MRQFLWGMVFGAATVFLWANFGENIQTFRRYTLGWRDWAVHQSLGYSAGRDPKK